MAMQEELQPKGASIVKNLLEATVGVQGGVFLLTVVLKGQAMLRQEVYILEISMPYSGRQALRRGCCDSATGVPLQIYIRCARMRTGAFNSLLP